jgi:hypothetical protein
MLPSLVGGGLGAKAWAAHLSSLDFVLLIRDHLRILAPLVSPPRSPATDAHAAHPSSADSTTAAIAAASPPTTAAATSYGEVEIVQRAAGSGGAAVGSTVHTVRVATFDILGILGSMCRLYKDAFSLESLCQEGLRGLMQLLAYPDILTALIRLVLSPEMRLSFLHKPDPAGGSWTFSGVHMLQMALCNASGAIMKAVSVLPRTEIALWKKLQQNLAHILNSTNNLPYLEELAFPAVPNGACGCRWPAGLRSCSAATPCFACRKLVECSKRG